MEDSEGCFGEGDLWVKNKQFGVNILTPNCLFDIIKCKLLSINL